MLKSTPLVARAFAPALLPGSPAAGETIDHAATRFDVDQCRHKQGREPEDYGEWRCAGYAGIAVVMTAGGQRIYVSYSPMARRERPATQTLGAPSGEARSIEWRMVRAPGRKGRPFATIMRWTTAVVAADPQGGRGGPCGEGLVVTRVG